jgi:hypothetical protein
MVVPTFMSQKHGYFVNLCFKLWCLFIYLSKNLRKGGRHSTGIYKKG